MTNVPVKGNVLRWARKFRGLDEEQAAKRLGISVRDLLGYENEDREPTITLFEKFSAQYQLPQATLFLENPPETPSDPTDFRTLGSRDSGGHTFDFKVALSTIRTWLFQLERVVADDEEFVPPTLPTVSFSEDPGQAGERERRRIGVSVQEQLSWTQQEAFGRWRAHLENVGVYVFQAKFPVSDGRGFSLYESKNSPTVVINKDEASDLAKCFTLWHEYCHLLLRKPGVSDHGRGNSVEQFCNRFAAAFLLPTDALREILPVWPNNPVAWDPSDIDRWARRLKMSRIVLALRLEHMRLAPNGFSNQFRWDVKPTRKIQGERGPDFTKIRLSELGFSFTRQIMGAVERGAIDTVQAVEALGIAPDSFNKAREYVARRQAMVEGVE